MKYGGVLFAVSDLKKSIEFYEDVLQLKLVHDFGSNVAFDNGLSLQTLDSWQDFIQNKEVTFYANNAELYFEEENFDSFVKKLKNRDDITYVHGVIEHRWGQRAVRIYDPDGHIIEISECIPQVCMRFLNSGLTIEQTAIRMDVSVDYIKDCIKE